MSNSKKDLANEAIQLMQKIWPTLEHGENEDLEQLERMIKELGKKEDKQLIMTGIALIQKEREEQIYKHGRTIEKDFIENDKDQLIHGAVGLLYNNQRRDSLFPAGWDTEIWRKMTSKSKKERIIMSGALLAAHIDLMNYNELNK